jgi:cyclic di-GMP phosphodiesterase
MKTMRKMLPVVRSHHEKLDRSGYPEGLAGSQIPMTVRIITVADVFDALTSERAYRQAHRLDMAQEVLAEGVRKGWWDGAVVEELRGSVAAMGVIGDEPGRPR